jgi:hypothetical protein
LDYSFYNIITYEFLLFGHKIRKQFPDILDLDVISMEVSGFYPAIYIKIE